MLPSQHFLNFIEQNNLFTKSDKLLVAVSGGRDSVLLTYLLKNAGFDLGIAHCNFKLRGAEADAEQGFVANLALKLDVPFYTVNFDTANYAEQKGISIQMAARELRYQWFEQTRQELGYTYIAVAHHQNDSVETILLNLTRGTGIAGMHGILPKNGLIVRPLLFLSRDKIDAIVKEEKLPYVEDSSNASVKYARNKLRLEVIPRLKELNPKLEETFNSNMERFRELEALLEHHIETLRQKLFVHHDNEIHIAIDGIKNLHPKRLLLFGLLNEYGFNETIIDDIIDSLDKHPGRVFESYGFVLVLDRDKLILAKRVDERTEPVLINRDDHEVNYGGFKVTLLHDDSPLVVRDNPMAVSVDAEKLVYPLTIRSWKEGDYFYPLGMKGRKKLSDFFISEKIPVHQKGKIPILVNSNDDIIWVGGYRPDERYKVSAYTKKVIIFELYI